MRRALSAAVLAALLSAPAAGAWTWPSDGAVLRAFAVGDDPYAGGQHRGVDVAGDAGGTVRAPAAGTVSFAGTLPTHGKTVTLVTGDGYTVTLLHLGSISVAKGRCRRRGRNGRDDRPEWDAGGRGAVRAPRHPAVRRRQRLRRPDDAAAGPRACAEPALAGPAGARASRRAAGRSRRARAAAHGSGPCSGLLRRSPPRRLLRRRHRHRRRRSPRRPRRGRPSPRRNPFPHPRRSGRPTRSPHLPRPFRPMRPPLQPRSFTRLPRPHPHVWGHRPRRFRPEPAPAAAPAPPPHAAAEPAPVRSAQPLVRGRRTRPTATLAPARSRPRRSEPRGTATRSVARPVPRPGPGPAPPHDPVLAAPGTAPAAGAGQASAGSVSSRRPFPTLPLLLSGLGALAALAGCGLWRTRRARIMGPRAEVAPQDPGRPGLAVRERPAAYRPRGRVRRTCGRVRALPAASGQRRADGLGHRRARHARDGRGRAGRHLVP